MSERKILLLAAGHNRVKKVVIDGKREWDGDLVALDLDPGCNPDILWDAESIPLPFEDATFDEIHAYDCLEHWGRQGDWRGWFAEMGEYHRLLKPEGVFCALVPQGDDRFADPGHTRFFSLNYFLFLSQRFYEDALAKKLQVTDYRWFWEKDFDVEGAQMIDGHHLAVVLRKR